MAREKQEPQWVRSLQSRLDTNLCHCDEDEWHVRVDDGIKLAYAYEIRAYNMNWAPFKGRPARYQTDLLIYDVHDDGRWVPRIVVECKINGVSTHDALTYSSKASMHKYVHPYLRYGILVACEAALPGRLLRHGADFDFMAVWSDKQPTDEEWDSLMDVLTEEVRISRTLQAILSDSRTKRRKKYKLLHRPLRLTESTV
jgi:hypothetical protein